MSGNGNLKSGKDSRIWIRVLTNVFILSQMTTRSNTPASPPHPGLQPGLKNAEYMKRWAPVSGLTPGLKEHGHTGKSGYVTVLTSYPMANRH
jgi:hypothetical protein